MLAFFSGNLLGKLAVRKAVEGTCAKIFNQII
jgi:hypothetical protein